MSGHPVLPAEKIKLPLLPLRDVVVFPHMVIPLFVGRPKSIKALEVAMEAGRQIMLVAQKAAGKDEPKPDVPSLVDWPYQQMCRLDPNKPIMIAEWATGEFPLTTAPPSAIRKPAWIKQGLELFRTRYPRIRAALYWHERWQNADGSYSNLRVNSSVESLQAYRDGIAHPDWLGDLILRAIPKK